MIRVMSRGLREVSGDESGWFEVMAAVVSEASLDFQRNGIEFFFAEFGFRFCAALGRLELFLCTV